MSRDSNITAQTCVKAAAELFASSGNVQGALDAANQFFQFITSVAPPAADPSPITHTQAVQNVAAQFPQASVQQSWDKYADVFQNPDNWYNNLNDPKATSGGGKGPDFRHKSMTGSNGQKVGIWLYSQYSKDVPAWFYEKLGVPAPTAQAPAPQQTGQSGAAGFTPPQQFGPSEAPF